MATTYRTARKSYEGCCMCGGSIRSGQQYCDYGRGVRECRRCVGDENFPAPKPRTTRQPKLTREEADRAWRATLPTIRFVELDGSYKDWRDVPGGGQVCVGEGRITR